MFSFESTLTLMSVNFCSGMLFREVFRFLDIGICFAIFIAFDF